MVAPAEQPYPPRERRTMKKQKNIHRQHKYIIKQLFNQIRTWKRWSDLLPVIAPSSPFICFQSLVVSGVSLCAALSGAVVLWNAKRSHATSLPITGDPSLILNSVQELKRVYKSLQNEALKVSVLGSSRLWHAIIIKTQDGPKSLLVKERELHHTWCRFLISFWIHWDL